MVPFLITVKRLKERKKKLGHCIGAKEKVVLRSMIMKGKKGNVFRL